MNSIFLVGNQALKLDNNQVSIIDLKKELKSINLDDFPGMHLKFKDTLDYGKKTYLYQGDSSYIKSINSYFIFLDEGKYHD